MARVAERVPGWVARFLLPEIRALIKEETKDLKTYMDDKFKTFDERLETFNEKFKALDERLISLRNEMNARFDSLESRVDVLQRVAVLEAEVRELKKRLEQKTI
ncbi:hypothetical protein HRbin02_00720 [Candidatus Calditenuaceae archaeon HR02]|nr:hypothetical protein HRbin02_00720 [Candidatus Calditenuaceae archaeon HR02]